jgi:hypothetical protein
MRPLLLSTFHICSPFPPRNMQKPELRFAIRIQPDTLARDCTTSYQDLTDHPGLRNGPE